MRPIALRRLQALVLTAVLLVGGSGASALDLALYHLGGAGAETPSHRISGTDTPRSHADSCVLLDWTARAPYTAALGSQPLQPVAADADRSRPILVHTPRATDLHPTSRPRAPPVPLA